MLTKKHSILIFSKSDFLRSEVGHLSIIQKDNYNWLYFDPLHNYLNWIILPIKSDEKEEYVIKECFKSGAARIIVVDTIQRSLKKIPIKFLTTCVDVVQYIAGIDRFSLTPKGLYKFLTKSTQEKFASCNVVNVKEYIKSVIEHDS